MGQSGYVENIAKLEKAVRDHAFIRDLSKHRNPDGGLDTAGNLRQWDEAAADFDKVYLWEDGDKRHAAGADGAYLIFIPADEPKRDTILVAHGGGFQWRTGCEGPNVAWEFHKRGYNTVILAYRLLPHGRAESVADMQRAIRLIRSKSKEWDLGEQVISMGFSAGAMLCGNCATHFDAGNPESEDLIERFSSRPDAAVISYGAMSCVSFPVPFGSDADLSLFGATAEEKFYFATEKHVSVKTPPMFIWQTLSDDGRHGMCLARALQDAGVPYELHIMDGGVHGLGLADGENDLGADVPHIAHWAQLCDEWLVMMKESEQKDGGRG